MKVCAFTIVTSNHLPGAITLKNTLLEFNPGWEVCAVVVDSLPAELTKDATISLITPKEVMAEEYFRKKIRQYSAAEICFFLKPYAAKYFLDRGYDQVHYFDSDIEIFSPLSPLNAELAKSNILLTPHFYLDTPSDYQQPNSLTLLKAGLFNAGYIGMRNTRETIRFLEWWSGRLNRYGRNEPANGMCGDQRWLDLCPLLFEGVRILRHPGCNVGYWNLHERHVTCQDKKYLVNGEPLMFFHFSGIHYKESGRLSKYSTSKKDMENSCIQLLAQEYVEKICRPEYEALRNLGPPKIRMIHSQNIIVRLIRTALFAISEIWAPGGKDDL
jgi:hypothetical protein